MGAIQYAVNTAARTQRHLVSRTRRVRSALYYRLRGTGPGTAVLKAAAFMTAPGESLERTRVAAAFNTNVGRALMDRSKGYGLVSGEQFGGIQDVLATCRALFDAKTAAFEAQVSEQASGSERLVQKRRFLRNLLSNDDLRETPALVDFALSDEALGIATHYLGTVPSLNRVDLLYSVPRETEDKIASQLFHVDPEGLSQVKFFINVFEIGEAEGPFTFIPADDSARILREIRQLRRRRKTPQVGRYTDEEVAAVGGTSAIVTVKGPAGAGVAVDTSRCLHLGSRVAPGAFRLCLYVQYCTSREHGNVFDVDRFRNDPVRYLAVRNSLASAGADVAAPHQMAG